MSDKDENRNATTFVLLISCGVMLGAGLGAAFGNVAIGIPAGMAVGSLAAIFAISARK